MSSMIRQNKIGSSTGKTLAEHGCDNEWEEIKCPICMEHPHNAILIRCSSYQFGCRPFMCNTSSRHSNCLDKYRNASESSPSNLTLDDSHCSFSFNFEEQGYNQRDHKQILNNVDGNENLTCPLCRGVVYGWTVIEPVRRYLNTKSRICSSQDCDFTGNYSDLRTHARLDHPFSRPTRIDLRRERDFARIVQDREFGDLIEQQQQQQQQQDVEVEVEVQIVVPQTHLHILFGLLGHLDYPNQTNVHIDDQEDVEVQIVLPQSYLHNLWRSIATMFYPNQANVQIDDDQMTVDSWESLVATTQRGGVPMNDVVQGRNRNSRLRNLDIRDDDSNFLRRRNPSNTFSQRSRYIANNINNHDVTRRRG
ncbi:hypothetical protein LINGRAHAP2_LOCUS23529 [Linum grandiflorum]